MPRFLRITAALALGLPPLPAWAQPGIPRVGELWVRRYVRTPGMPLPVARKSQSPRGYRLHFPGTDLPPVPEGPSRTRVSLRPGVELRITPPPHEGGFPPGLSVNGTPQPMSFSELYLERIKRGVTGKDLNELKYSISRGFINPRAYEFFGLVKAHGHVYLGVAWHSPAPSSQPRGGGYLFRLNWNGSQLSPVLIRSVDGTEGSTFSTSGPPLMDVVQGDLVLVSGTRGSRMDRHHRWHALPPLPDARPAAYYSQIWQRGRFLIVEGPLHDDPKDGPFDRASLLVVDILTGRRLRRYRWKELRS